LPSLYETNKKQGVPHADPHKPNHGLQHAAATIELEGGSLEAGDPTRSVDGAYVTADFVFTDGTGADPVDTRTIADKLHLKINGITCPIRISCSEWTAFFRPAPEPGSPTGSGVVEISITNLPPKTHPGPAPARLQHFGHYYDMIDWGTTGKPDLRLPKVSGLPVTGSSSVCPPARYDG
jgi:hypothetical protein